MTNGNKLIALVSFYQDRKAGELLLKNLDNHGIPSIWADSRIEGFPQINNSDYSTDGLDEVIRSYKNTTILSLGLVKPGETMNAMLAYAAKLKYKYTISMGCDEWLEGNYQLLQDNLERIGMKEPTKLRIPLVDHHADKHGGGHITERIVFMPKYVFLRDVHWVYFSNYQNKEKVLAMEPRSSPLVLGMELHHDDRRRDPERNKMMDEFQVEQRADEKVSCIAWIKAGIV